MLRASMIMLPALAALIGSANGQVPGPETASYRSIELRGGGTVSVRYGPERRVTVVAADPRRAIRSEADRLVIEPCRGGCRRGHGIAVEVVTPDLAELAVSDGGTIRLVGDFPPQAALAASVSDGGTIDMRPLAAGTVSASVSQGGRILASPRGQLAASISDGGFVTYWGDAEVRSSVRRGGAVQRGADADLDAPLEQFQTPLPHLAPLPPPPVPPVPKRAH